MHRERGRGLPYYFKFFLFNHLRYSSIKKKKFLWLPHHTKYRWWQLGGTVGESKNRTFHSNFITKQSQKDVVGITSVNFCTMNWILEKGVLCMLKIAPTDIFQMVTQIYDFIFGLVIWNKTKNTVISLILFITSKDYERSKFKNASVNFENFILLVFKNMKHQWNYSFSNKIILM